MLIMQLLRNTVGRKMIVAVSGLLLIGFVVAHLLGNVTIFFGTEALNAYGVHLRRLGPLLWSFRIGLLAAVVVHIYFGLLLTLENRAAKSTAYARNKPRRATLAGKSMIYSGLLLAVFVVYHLLHFTFRTTNPEISHFIDAAGRPDIFQMVVLSFRQPFISLLYLVGMAALGLHLMHGIGSFFQTIGANDEDSLPLLGRFGQVAALLLALGFSSIPILIYFRFVTI